MILHGTISVQNRDGTDEVVVEARNILDCISHWQKHEGASTLPWLALIVLADCVNPVDGFDRIGKAFSEARLTDEDRKVLRRTERRVKWILQDVEKRFRNGASISEIRLANPQSVTAVCFAENEKEITDILHEGFRNGTYGELGDRYVWKRDDLLCVVFEQVNSAYMV